MHDGGKLVHLLLVAVLFNISLGEQCPGSATSIADGSCNGENNNADCSYDGGDCCQCTCLDNLQYACGYHGFDCRDPTSPNVLSDCEGAPIVSAPCSTGVVLELEVWDTSSAEVLAKAVSCSGGLFDVTWRGYVELLEGIYISNDTILNITGSGPEATMDGRGSTRLFTVEGATLVLNNMIVFNGSAAAGGAIAAVESSLYLNQTSFVSNTAVGDGGAIYAVSHTTVVLSGNTSFVGNTAGSRGGALHVEHASNVSWPGNTLNAGDAVSSTAGDIDTDGGFASDEESATMFSDNQALSGGAVFVSKSSIMSWYTRMVFYSNRANSSGGAVFVSSSSGASWFGNTSFIGNKAVGDGGAIYVNQGYHQRGSPFLLLNGSTMFLQNHCEGSGGGLAVVTECAISLEVGGILFEGNSAEAAGGAVFISGLSMGLHFQAARFSSNRADVGGAVSLVSSGTAIRGDEHAYQTSGSVTFDQCSFEGNEAYWDGGAIHTWTGLCVIISTEFVNNFAVRGGAIYLASTGYLRDCTFVENSSIEDGGFAVYSPDGFTPDISGTSFFHNVPLCLPGRYRFFIHSRETPQWSHWFARVGCEGCSDICNNCSYYGESYCWDWPEHTYLRGFGNEALEDLFIDAGYWRPDNRSLEISPCYNSEACPGGQTGADGYHCTQGYKGVVCSLCDDGYMGTSDFRCIKCSGTSTGTVVIVVGSLLAVVALSMLTFYMISEKEISADPHGRLPETTATWRRPLQSLKIVIVAWQILTQFANAADVVYPGIYGDLLKGIEFFNFDFSWVLSTGCVVDLGFGERLVMFTVGPIAFSGFLAATYVFGMRKHRGSKSALATVRRNHLSVVILVTVLMYSSISSILFQTFVVDNIGNDSRVLRTDRRISSDSSELLQLRKLAIPMIVLYTLGIPVFYALLLFRNRKVLIDKTAREADLLAASTSTLWRLYRPECYYFELIECLRRVFFAAILTFIYPNSVSQVTVGLMVGLFFMMVSEALAPYASKLDAWVSRMGHAIVCTTMIWGILRKFEDVYDLLGVQEGEDSKHLFTGILLASHGLMVFAVLVETVVVTCQLMKARKVEDCSTPKVHRKRKVAPHSEGLKGLRNIAYWTRGQNPPRSYYGSRTFV